MKHEVNFKINGTPIHTSIEPNISLLTFIREHMGLKGTKEGCGAGDCGSCTVLVNGETVNSCLMLAVEADGKEILTVEGLAKNGEIDPIQQAFIDEGAVQCGYCTPGMLMSTKAILDKNPEPSEEEIKKGLSGNLCRCTGYKQIVNAVGRAVELRKRKGE